MPGPWKATRTRRYTLRRQSVVAENTGESPSRLTWLARTTAFIMYPGRPRRIAALKLQASRCRVSTSRRSTLIRQRTALARHSTDLVGCRISTAALVFAGSIASEALSELLVATIALALQLRCTIHDTGVVVRVVRLATSRALREFLLGRGTLEIAAFLTLRPRIDAVLLRSGAGGKAQ